MKELSPTERKIKAAATVCRSYFGGSRQQLTRVMSTTAACAFAATWRNKYGPQLITQPCHEWMDRRVRQDMLHNVDMMEVVKQGEIPGDPSKSPYDRMLDLTTEALIRLLIDRGRYRELMQWVDEVWVYNFTLRDNDVYFLYRMATCMRLINESTTGHVVLTGALCLANMDMLQLARR